MNFFEAQDDARRKTWRLGAMFGAAVVTLIILTNLLVAITFGFGGTQAGMTFSQAIANIPLDTWFWISGGVIGLVGVASLYKYLSIQGGGRAIAEALGGSMVSQSTRDHKQRQLLNVVEEMAIASGIAVPPVYLIPEESINAFAAGFSHEDAVIGINQGTLDLLNREELQGVVAHEFSHILNGDTNINLRLMAILHGILFIGIIGYGLLRAGGYSRRNGLPVIALGAGLALIGYGGTFFGNIIKAAVSRQREYLADASAVQFTRHPEGIANALKKIGGHITGSTMTADKAEEVSHMFFGNASAKLNSLFSTHPPLDERIRAIEPRWDGNFPTVVPTELRATPEGAMGFAGGVGAAVGSSVAGELTDAVGRPNGDSLTYAQQLIDENDDRLNDAARDPHDAQSLTYCMLIDADPEVRRGQLEFLQGSIEPNVYQQVVALLPLVQEADERHQLTLLEMAIPALKELSKPQYQAFSQSAARLITADGLVDVFEWVMHRLLTHGLRPHFEGPSKAKGNISRIERVATEASELLSILASLSNESAQDKIDAYQAGADSLGLDHSFSLQHHFDYQHMNKLLGRLRELQPLAKPALLKACAATVLSDQTVTAREAGLIQGIAATLDCPLPPNVLAG